MTAAPCPVIPFSIYRLFDTTGDRKAYEAFYFGHRRRLSTFAALALIEGNVRWLRAAEDAVWAICDEYTWALPAHLGGQSLSPAGCTAFSAFGAGSAQARRHRETLDLFSCETAFALAEILWLLHGRMEPLVVARAGSEILERVLRPYASLSPIYGWETAEMNWAAVCAGSIGAAAMYLIEEDETLCPILQRTLDTMSCYHDGLQDDGYCLEGLGYWNYGIGFYTYFSSLLLQRTAGKFDLMADAKFKAAALFQQRGLLPGGQPIPFSDVSPHYRYSPGLTQKLAELFPEEVTLPPRQLAAGLFDECSRWVPLVRNLLWSDPEYSGEKEKAPENTFYYFKESGILVSSAAHKERTASFCAKAGHNGEPHNHNDLGSFLIALNGEPVLTDPGRGLYSKEYFSEKRYEVLANGSQGHSVPIIEGHYQAEGKAHRAEVLAASRGETEDLFELEFAEAYGEDAHLLSLRRSFRFDKSSFGLTIADQFRFSRTPASLVERFVTFLPPDQADENTVLLHGKAADAELRFEAAVFAFSFRCEKFLPQEKGRGCLYLLDFTAKHPAARFRASFAVHESRRKPVVL